MHDFNTEEEAARVAGLGSKFQVITAPDRLPVTGEITIFLAGTTTDTGDGDWREFLMDALSDFPITFFDPKRNDWDSTWKEDLSDERWAEQVQWEMDMQAKADVVVFFFHSATLAPVSMLELGLCAERAVVCALDGYSKRGNVQAVCERFQSPFVSTLAELQAKMLDVLDSHKVQRR
ncbi:Fc.00g114720.m01.CDS01 [Cosmosporella sp. VM-42]